MQSIFFFFGGFGGLLTTLGVGGGVFGLTGAGVTLLGAGVLTVLGAGVAGAGGGGVPGV